MWWWLGRAEAGPALAGYDEVLARDAWRRIDARMQDGCHFDPAQQGVVCAEGVTASVVEAVDAFERELFPDGPLEYLAGLASKYGGDDTAAERRYREALRLDPSLVEAWYDLGEILFASGRTTEARTAFQEVADRNRAPATAWLGPWRLAEVAATEHDPVGFSQNLEEALRRGFTFRTVAGLPNWKAYYADPALHDTLVGLLGVYADPSVEASLRP